MRDAATGYIYVVIRERRFAGSQNAKAEVYHLQSERI